MWGGHRRRQRNRRRNEDSQENENPQRENIKYSPYKFTGETGGDGCAILLVLAALTVVTLTGVEVYNRFFQDKGAERQAEKKGGIELKIEHEEKNINYNPK